MDLDDLDLDLDIDLANRIAEENSKAEELAKPKPPAPPPPRPMAITIFTKTIVCQRCGGQTEVPRFTGDSAYVKVGYPTWQNI